MQKYTSGERVLLLLISLRAMPPRLTPRRFDTGWRNEGLLSKDFEGR